MVKMIDPLQPNISYKILKLFSLHMVKDDCPPVWLTNI